MLSCYSVTVLLMLLYIMVLYCSCETNLTICYWVTLLLCFWCNYMLQCYTVTNLLVLLYPTVLSYLVTNVTIWYSVTFLLLLILLHGTIITCSYGIRVNIWYSVTLLLYYKCYCMLLCYRVTKYGIASCYYVINVTICCSVTLILCYWCYCMV